MKNIFALRMLVVVTMVSGICTGGVSAVGPTVKQDDGGCLSADRFGVGVYGGPWEWVGI